MDRVSDTLIFLGRNIVLVTFRIRLMDTIFQENWHGGVGSGPEQALAPNRIGERQHQTAVNNTIFGFNLKCKNTSKENNLNKELNGKKRKSLGAFDGKMNG